VATMRVWRRCSGAAGAVMDGDDIVVRR